MRERKVVLTLEIMTKKPIRILRKKENIYLTISDGMGGFDYTKIIQIQADEVKKNGKNKD